MIFKLIILVGAVLAQRPSNTSLCDFYTSYIFTNNTSQNQYKFVNLVINAAFIGKYTKPNLGLVVPGILRAGSFNGTRVNLAPYFNGGLASSNTGGDVGIPVNFFDGGGTAPLRLNRPSNDMYSNQYGLFTHLYGFFGGLFQCTLMDTAQFPKYDGNVSMYEVHRFMDHTTDEFGYFIQQITLSLSSFNVSQEEVTNIGNNLTSVFGVRCAHPTSLFGNQIAELQSICLADNCRIAANDTCASYARAVRPTVSNDTLVANTTFATTANTDSGILTITTTRSGSTTTRTAALTISPTSGTSTASSSRSSGGSQQTTGGGIAVSGVVVVGGLFVILL